VARCSAKVKIGIRARIQLRDHPREQIPLLLHRAERLRSMDVERDCGRYSNADVPGASDPNTLCPIGLEYERVGAGRSIDSQTIRERVACRIYIAPPGAEVETYAV
jgi:hypothetical protein